MNLIDVDAISFHSKISAMIQHHNQSQCDSDIDAQVDEVIDGRQDMHKEVKDKVKKVVFGDENE